MSKAKVCFHNKPSLKAAQQLQVGHVVLARVHRRHDILQSVPLLNLVLHELRVGRVYRVDNVESLQVFVGEILTLELLREWLHDLKSEHPKPHGNEFPEPLAEELLLVGGVRYACRRTNK